MGQLLKTVLRTTFSALLTNLMGMRMWVVAIRSKGSRLLFKTTIRSVLLLQLKHRRLLLELLTATWQSRPKAAVLPVLLQGTWRWRTRTWRVLLPLLGTLRWKQLQRQCSSSMKNCHQKKRFEIDKHTPPISPIFKHARLLARTHAAPARWSQPC